MRTHPLSVSLSLGACAQLLICCSPRQARGAVAGCAGGRSGGKKISSSRRWDDGRPAGAARLSTTRSRTFQTDFPLLCCSDAWDEQPKANPQHELCCTCCLQSVAAAARKPATDEHEWWALAFSGCPPKPPCETSRPPKEPIRSTFQTILKR